MKKFLIGITLFLLPIIILSITFEFLLREIPNDYSYKNEYLKKNSNHIKILFLGSSHAYYGINPLYITSTSFNASYISQSLNYDLEIVKKSDVQWKNLSYIVIPIDYFSLYSTLETSVERWRLKNYQIYYNIHTSYDISDNLEITTTPHLNINKLKEFYILNKSFITCSELGWGNAYGSKNKQDLERSGKIAATRHRKQRNQQLINNNTKCLKSIIVYAQSKNIKVLLYTTPAYKTYVNRLDNSQLNETISIANKLADFYPNTKYINLLKDSSFVASDYYDADHLNEIGAEKLTKRINELILSSWE